MLENDTARMEAEARVDEYIAAWDASMSLDIAEAYDVPGLFLCTAEDGMRLAEALDRLEDATAGIRKAAAEHPAELREAMATARAEAEAFEENDRDAVSRMFADMARAAGAVE